MVEEEVRDSLAELTDMLPPATAEDMEFVVRHIMRVQDIFLAPFEGGQYKTIPLPYQMGEVALRYAVTAVIQSSENLWDQVTTRYDAEEMMDAQDTFDFAVHPRA